MGQFTMFDVYMFTICASLASFIFGVCVGLDIADYLARKKKQRLP